jgi:hypothetical protein
VVGGLAARHDLSYEALEDLQLALVTVLEGEQYPAGDEVGVELRVSDDSIELVIGPLKGDVVRAALESSSEELGLGRLLGTLVEDAGVEAREDGDWLRLVKRADGIRPAGANA